MGVDVVAGGAVDNAVDLAPDARNRAHSARLEPTVQRAIPELGCFPRLAKLAQFDNFGMR
jgi:hypothetical protein